MGSRTTASGRLRVTRRASTDARTEVDERVCPELGERKHRRAPAHRLTIASASSARTSENRRPVEPEITGHRGRSELDRLELGAKRLDRCGHGGGVKGARDVQQNRAHAVLARIAGGRTEQVGRTGEHGLTGRVLVCQHDPVLACQAHDLLL